MSRTRLAAEGIVPAPVEPRSGTRRTMWWVVGAMVLTAALVLFALGGPLVASPTSYGLVVVPVMLLVLLLLIRREERSAPGFDIGGVLFAAFATKMLMAFLRLYMVETVYNGAADSTGYDGWGRLLAEHYRDFAFSVDPEKPIPGTGFVRVLTGVVYVVVGSDKFAGFLVFSLFAFLGCYLLYRAVVTAIPGGNHYRYAVLVFFWPSLVFFPSSIGKESWMVLCIGLASFGAARLLVRAPGGYFALVLGVLGMYAARPHMAILLVAAVAVGLVIGLLFRAGHGVKSLGTLSKLSAVAVLLVMGAFLAPRVARFFDVDDAGGTGFGQVLEQTTERTDEGGSSFEPADIESALDYPWALVTVLFRPFPTEATNGQSLVSAIEGVVLVGLLALSIRQLRSLPVEIIKQPYAAFALAYALMFVYVFAFIANFGILARQRTQVLPFLFVMLALSAARGRSSPDAVASAPPSSAPVGHG